MRTLAVVALMASAVSATAADFGGGHASAPDVIPTLWTGFYVGGHAGAHFGSGAGATYTESGNFEFADTRKDLPFDTNAVFGIQGGYLFQAGPLVLGGELSASALAAEGELKENPPPLGNDYRSEATLGPVLAAKGRAGLAVDRLMVYGTGGYAWSKLDFDASFNSGVDPVTLLPTRTGISDTVGVHGWVYGGGLEFALSKNVSFGVEYLHYALEGDAKVFNVVNSGITTEKVKPDVDLDTVAAKLNFRF